MYIIIDEAINAIGPLKLILPLNAKYNPPKHKAKIDTSPIFPFACPIILSIKGTTTSVALADVVASLAGFAITPAQEAIKNALVAAAGFIKFWASPPKNCLTTILANTDPIIGIHKGTWVGITRATNIPKTIGLKSVINLVFLTYLFQIPSAIREVKIVATIILTASIL